MNSNTLKTRTYPLFAAAALAATMALTTGGCKKEQTQAAAPAAPAAAAPAAAAAGSAATPAAATAPATGGKDDVTIDTPHVPVGEWPMWALTNHRNYVSPEKNPPTDWDVSTGKNVLWSQTLGSNSYGNPIVAQGIVSIGTNNEGHRDPNNTADSGVEMAFDQNTGKFLWQKVYSKLPTGRVNDWPEEGLCATAYSEQGRLWYCTNQCHVVCLDMSPGATKLPDGSPPVIWDYDMIAKLGVFPHNMTASAIASYGDLIYCITGNGVDDPHKHVVSPNAPGIVCFNKNTGKVVWTDNSPGPNVLHGQWSSVAIVEVNGNPLVIAPLGDAWVYAYEAKTGKIVWKFDCNLKDGVYPQTRNEVIATPCISGKYMYIANGQDPEHGEDHGHLWCVDITGKGDVSWELDADPAAAKPSIETELLKNANTPTKSKGKPNPNSHVVWHFDVDHSKTKPTRADYMNRTISTAVVTPEGLCLVPDLTGFLHCLDAKTGQIYWTYDMESEMWGTPLYVDGKIYLTDEDGEVRIFKASKEPPVKSEIITHTMNGNCYSSPVLVNGVLYVMTRDHLFAIKNGAQSAGVKAN